MYVQEGMLVGCVYVCVCVCACVCVSVHTLCLCGDSVYTGDQMCAPPMVASQWACVLVYQCARVGVEFFPHHHTVQRCAHTCQKLTKPHVCSAPGSHLG
jgi:hypothetical protein